MSAVPGLIPEFNVTLLHCHCHGYFVNTLSCRSQDVHGYPQWNLNHSAYKVRILQLRTTERWKRKGRAAYGRTSRELSFPDIHKFIQMPLMGVDGLPVHAPECLSIVPYYILRDNHYHYQPSKTSFVGCAVDGGGGRRMNLLLVILYILLHPKCHDCTTTRNIRTLYIQNSLRFQL